jgi:hypothetical protein
VGTTTKLARDISIPIIDEVLIAKWASEQAKLIKKPFKESRNMHAEIIRSCGGDVNNLEIAYSNYGWMNYQQIVERYILYEEIIMLDNSNYDHEKENIEKIGYYLGLEDNVIELEDNVIVVSHQPRTLIYGVRDWPSHKESVKLTLHDLVIEALSEAWSSSVEEIIEVSESENHIKIGKYNDVAIEVKADRIINPNCFE